MIRTNRQAIIRIILVALTAVFAALALIINQGEAGALIAPEVGQPAPQDYVATRQITITDEATPAAAISSATFHPSLMWCSTNRKPNSSRRRSTVRMSS